MTPTPSSSHEPSRDTIPVLLLKTKSTPHDRYEELFSTTTGKITYEPIFVPVLEHRFDAENLKKVRDLFVFGPLKEKYGGLVFTSQRAVEGFSRMIVEEVGQSCAGDASRNLALYTVGPATYRSLNTLRKTHLPHATLLGENAGTGELLAPLILEHYNNLERNQSARSSNPDDAHGKLPLLFLVGDVHRDIIPKTLMSPELPVHERIQIDELVVYETTVMESFRQDFSAVLERLNRDTTGDEEKECQAPIWVVVFSPTGCDAMVDILGVRARNNLEQSEGQQIRELMNRRRKCYIATIGPTTRDHLRSNFGVEPDVCAEQPSPEGVGKGIEMVMNKRAHEDCVQD